jgi:ubiquinone biosynthesis protein COQ9
LNWYTKRAILSSIYAATGNIFSLCAYFEELFMITDKSHDFKSTWEFLDRRVEDAINLSHFGTEVSS